MPMDVAAPHIAATAPDLAPLAAEMRAWRHDIHRHPELGMAEQRTAGKVAGLLASWGIEVDAGFGGTTAVIGTLLGTRRGDGAGRSIGLRADMDALPMPEQADVAYRSVHAGVAHACGHDGHTAMLLGAAKYLADHRDFNGTVQFIFQPAEEPLTGAAALLDHGLLERHPCDEVYALHNNNAVPAGTIGVRAGAILAANDLFRIHITGVGGHAAQPQRTVDPILVGTALVQALQSVVSRNIDPLDTAVLSICQFHAGSAINVIADHAVLEGTLRTMSHQAQETALQRLRTLCAGVAASYDCQVRCEHLLSTPPTINHPAQTELVRRAAAVVVGAQNVVETPPLMASEDFSLLLEQRPGAYFFLGHDGLNCHHPAFVFDDDTLATGAAVLVEIVRQRALANGSRKHLT